MRGGSLSLLGWWAPFGTIPPTADSTAEDIAFGSLGNQCIERLGGGGSWYCMMGTAGVGPFPQVR